MEELATRQEATSTAQEVEALEARIEALHAAKLLTDEELFVCEDILADLAEAKAGFALVTMEAVATKRAVAISHRLIALSEATSRDEALARQLRRKFS